MARSLVLRPSPGGEFSVWEPPIPGREYIIGCDPSMGRRSTEHDDHSSIQVFRREPGHKLIQVAHWWAVWTAGRVGEVVACLGKAYCSINRYGKEVPALLNIERNLVDALIYALRREDYPESRFYVNPKNRQAEGFEVPYFFQKQASNQHLMLNLLVDYMENAQLELRDRDTQRELMTLERDEASGMPKTRGKDRSVAVMMAVVADHDTPECQPYEQQVATPVAKEPPFGVDPDTWRELHGIEKETVRRSLPRRPGWEDNFLG